MSNTMSRLVARGVVRATLGVALLGTTFAAASFNTGPAIAANPPGSLRAQYHLTPPQTNLSDPQRPVYVNGKYNLYYLYADGTNGGGWRHATTTDNAVFADAGMAIPQSSSFPVWSGSAVVDTKNTANLGAGTIIVLATQPPGNDRYSQQQYLWYSRDGGTSFQPYGPTVIANPHPPDNWFRDPKIVRDEANNRWVAVIGEYQAARFYVSTDLKSWTYKSTFSYTTPNIGGFECTDLFQIRASDGTTHWVLGASMHGRYSGAPNTYAYWIGNWNGTTGNFTPESNSQNPQWMDWGMDWYAAVTWPNEASPLDSRFAIGWMNNWDYANNPTPAPTIASDGYSGQMSVVRQITLAKQSDNSYSFLSQPVSSLDNIVTNTVHPASVVVNSATGPADLAYHGVAYELETDVSWQQLNNVGLSVGVSADGTRHTDLGVFQNKTFYLNRGNSARRLADGSDPYFNSWEQSQSAFDPAVRSVHLKVFVDRGSVEVFVDNGKVVHSSQVLFEAGDTGIRLYTDQGSATFSNMVIKEFGASATTGAVRWGSNTNKCVDRDVSSGRVQIWDCNGNLNQTWTLNADGSLTTGGLCMETPGTSPSPNLTPVRVYSCNGGSNQKWTRGANGSLINELSSRCLDLASGDTTNGRQLQIYDCSGGTNQNWLGLG